MLQVGQRHPLGVTIGATVIEAAERGSRVPGQPWSRTIEPLAIGELLWPSLTDALRELRAAHRGSGTELAATLLPPLVEVRPVALPPLAADDARQIIARNAARYFVGAREPQVIGLGALRADAAEGTRIIAAAPARLIDAIHTAAREAGWKVRTIVPAVAAWRAAALAIWPELRHGTHEVVVIRSGGVELLQLESGTLAGVRRFGEAAANASAVRDALASPSGAPTGTLAVLGLPARREALGKTLGVVGARLMPSSAKWDALADSPELAAAAFATCGPELELISETVRQLHRTRRARFTAAIAGVAAGLLIVAGVLELWGIRRELDYIQRERAALRPKVGALIATRDSAMVADHRLGELAAANRQAVPWSRLLITLTEALPRDAHLTGFRAQGDSLIIEGLADRAAPTFAALEAIPELSDVRSAAPVRRDLRDRAAAEVRERFSVGARLTPVRDTIARAGATYTRHP